MKEKALVILAAGMGSRFGGLKQIEPVGPNNEFITDYSIYSALKYGFNKIIFIIKEENYDIFKTTIGNRIEKKVKVEYVFQKNEDILDEIKIPLSRVKPLGTAHALYAARDKINGNFAIITSDDFYGDDAFRVLSNSLDEENVYTIIGYPLSETLSQNGAVKRGVVIENNNKVERIIESSCEIKEDKVFCKPLDSNIEEFYVEKNNPCSMLMNGFTPQIFQSIKDLMLKEYKNHENEMDTYEFLLPDVIDYEIKNKKSVQVVKTTSKWMGITYHDDLDKLKEFIKEEIDKGIYPENLWE